MAGLFSAYGINWVLKSQIFWDKGFYNDPEAIAGLPQILINSTLLSLFFMFPWLAAKNKEPIEPLAVMVSCILFSMGNFFHYGADAQKFFTLKYKGSGLIKDGFFSKLRNPSYFGEDLIFAAFTIVAGIKNPLVWIPVAYLELGKLVLGTKKKHSLARYEDYEEWRKSTWF